MAIIQETSAKIILCSKSGSNFSAYVAMFEREKLEELNQIGGAIAKEGSKTARFLLFGTVYAIIDAGLRQQKIINQPGRPNISRYSD